MAAVAVAVAADVRREITTETQAVISAVKRLFGSKDWPGCKDHAASFTEGCGACLRVAMNCGHKAPASRAQLIAAVRELSELSK